MVSTVDKDEDVKFLHSNGPSFYWPKYKDSCAVPVSHVFAAVDPPQTTSGRTYCFSKDYMMSMEEKMAHMELCYAKEAEIFGLKGQKLYLSSVSKQLIIYGTNILSFNSYYYKFTVVLKYNYFKSLCFPSFRDK